MSQDFRIALSAGSNVVIAAPGPHQFIRVLNYHHTTTTIAGRIEWKSGSTLVAKDHLSLDREVQANGSDSGVFDCAPGQALNADLFIGGGTFVGGCGKYTIKGGV
jgi:hypothetical protein